ncbi:hypothetical protein PMZ80_002408 [Knufia obscura]|uniref:Uncharacterized protein n=2 Tax=Knufia TaxID=430999 RepID=A0AAN8I3P4_9EURO|nr:hypothetical protein PMZ80_002408 [Knufia obscura]KAK5948591.1 hypothetical protein OHC33_010350 [Knufia fluminis]
MSASDPAKDLTSVSLDPSRVVLDTLPTEIQDLIFHHVVADSSREELKQFRQSNRYFRDRADIHLFGTLHVSASNLSLERVRHVSENDRLNVYVKELIYHRGTFSGHKMVKFGGGTHMQPRDYDDFETYLVRSRDSKAYIPQASKCYDAFLEEVEAEALFNREISWRATMKKYCSRFPKLEKLTTLPDAQDRESTYLRRRCAMIHQSSTPNYFAPYEIFEPCGPNFRPVSLSLDGVNGEDFASIMTNIRGGLQAVRERFSKLQSFRLSFSETVSSLEIEGTYDLFIPACVNLRDLSLGFTSFYSSKMLKDSESFPRKLIRLVLQQHFSKLANLNLVYALMTEHDFVSFLDRHQSTLKTLYLHRWPMPVTTDLKPTGSVIRTFWKMGQLPMQCLCSVRLTGEFSNSKYGEGWEMNENTAYDRNTHPFPTLPRLIRYLEDSNEHEFPIPISREVMEAAKTGEALDALDALPDVLGYSDSTFTWWENQDEAFCTKFD